MNLMTSEFNVERTEFDLDTFQRILEAMDGYHVLPWLKKSGDDDGTTIDVEPWELPGMPCVSVDAWRYHVGFAIDRGFIECWSPDQMDKPTFRPMREFMMERVGQMLNKEKKPPPHGQDPNVSSELRPARLTYAGKEFVDNLNNPSVKAQAVEAIKKWGLPVMMQVVVEAAKQLIPTELPTAGHPQTAQQHSAIV